MKLKTNDHIALLCTGSICTDPAHPQMTQDYLKEHYQLIASYPDDINQGLSPLRRAQIFLSYLFDDNVKMIGALRGGEGTADILPYLHEYHDKIKLLKPKILLGHSDFTALLVYFEKYYRWPVIHGPSLRQFAQGVVDKKSEKETMDLVFGMKQDLCLRALTPLNDSARENKIIDAQITGGNLSLINVSIKDIWEIETDNKILFFEDCGEKAHVIIRTLKYFSRIGLFAKTKAMILGDFTCWPIGYDKTRQENNRQAILKILSSFANHHDFPVLYTPQFGHGKVNFPLVYSKPYRLQLGSHAQLELLHNIG